MWWRKRKNNLYQVFIIVRDGKPSLVLNLNGTYIPIIFVNLSPEEETRLDTWMEEAVRRERARDIPGVPGDCYELKRPLPGWLIDRRWISPAYYVVLTDSSFPVPEEDWRWWTEFAEKMKESMKEVLGGIKAG